MGSSARLHEVSSCIDTEANVPATLIRSKCENVLIDWRTTEIRVQKDLIPSQYDNVDGEPSCDCGTSEAEIDMQIGFTQISLLRGSVRITGPGLAVAKAFANGLG